MDFSGWLVHILLLSPFFSTWFSEYHTLSIVTSSFIKLSILEYFIDKIFTFDRIWGFTDKTTKSTFGPVLQDNTVLLIGIGPNCEVILELCVDGWLVMGFSLYGPGQHCRSRNDYIGVWTCMQSLLQCLQNNI